MNEVLNNLDEEFQQYTKVASDKNRGWSDIDEMVSALATLGTTVCFVWVERHACQC